MENVSRTFGFPGKPGKWVHFRDLLPGDKLTVDEDGKPMGVRTVKEIGNGMPKGTLMVTYREGGFTCERPTTAVQLED